MEQMESKHCSLENDLYDCDWMCEKIKDEIYAQNLYAALCNNDFVKNEEFPILKQQYWHCSWRHAGGIISDMQGQGDYLDWYCSGIKNVTYDTVNDEKIFRSKQYVPEGTVTDEIRKDLLKLGWVVINNDK